MGLFIFLEKYDKYNYIPIGIESIVGRIIEELVYN